VEQDKPFEAYQPHLFPRLERAGAFLSSVWNAGHVTELCLTEHNTGAATMLDQHLEAQPELPFPKYEPLPIIERPDAGQLTRNTFDDMGNYYSPYIDRSRS
jgi:hypothetical protein